MHGVPEPSDWAKERFGGLAAVLMSEIPAALRAAHNRAVAAYDGLGVKTNEAYGLIWLAQHEELVARLEKIEGTRRIKPRGARYELAVIGDIVLYPWRYADGTGSALEHVRMELSGVRRNLLALGEAPADEQLTLDSAEIDDEELNAEFDQAREDFMDLAASLRMVTIAYASNPRSGVLHVAWGDATQADEDGHLHWLYHEPLPVADPGNATGGQPAPLVPVAPVTGSGGAARRFDDAPLIELDLTARNPLTGPDSEPTPDSETGSDDH